MDKEQGESIAAALDTLSETLDSGLTDFTRESAKLSAKLDQLIAAVLRLATEHHGAGREGDCPDAMQARPCQCSCHG